MTSDTQPDFAAICADQTAAVDGLLAEVRRANAERWLAQLQARALRDALALAHERIEVLETRLELERDA